METVQFQCGHCGSMMGVGQEYLGQQVRCPTCQQVVFAPTASAPSPESDPDALFLANLQSAPIGDPPQPELQPSVTTAPEPRTPITSDAVPHSEPSLPWNDPASRAAGPNSPVARAQRQAGGGISWLWLLPLLSYSILVSWFVYKLYDSLQIANATIRDLDEKRKKRLDMMPDLNGDAPLTKSQTFVYPSDMTTRELPDEWKSKLGQAVTIGSLEITPLAVEKRTVAIDKEGALKGTNRRREVGVLALRLRFRNLSEQFDFVPLDLYFERCHFEGELPPFTCLELDSERRFYGGPAAWFPRNGRKAIEREQIVGRDNNQVLKRGESLETFVCSGSGEKLDEAAGHLRGQPVLARPPSLRSGGTSGQAGGCDGRPGRRVQRPRLPHEMMPRHVCIGISEKRDRKRINRDCLALTPA